MLIVIDTPKMVESSVVPPGPRSTASPTNKPIDVDADLDLVTLNNNNNHEYHGVENEKGQNGVDPINDGQLIIGNGDNANPKNEKLSQAEYKVLEEISVEDDVAEEDDTDEEEDYQDADEDEGAEEDFESLDEDEADEDEEDEPPETGALCSNIFMFCEVTQMPMGILSLTDLCHVCHRDRFRPSQSTIQSKF